jgi:D-alanyl-D-alanine carboxypeptidase
MWSRLLAIALLLLPAPALADVTEKVAALDPSGLVLVVDGKGNELVTQNADEPFVPASVTKIVTAWLALEVLGADYRFETHFFDSEVSGVVVLHENLPSFAPTADPLKQAVQNDAPMVKG